MTETVVPVLPPAPAVASAVRLDGHAPTWAVPITTSSGRTTRTLGVVLIDGSGARWQRTVDVERLLTVALATGAAAAACVALRRPGPRVERITMGPGGWVSFRGGDRPKARGLRRHEGSRRPWWAVVLRARPLDR